MVFVYRKWEVDIDPFKLRNDVEIITRRIIGSFLISICNVPMAEAAYGGGRTVSGEDQPPTRDEKHNNSSSNAKLDRKVLMLHIGGCGSLRYFLHDVVCIPRSLFKVFVIHIRHNDERIRHARSFMARCGNYFFARRRPRSYQCLISKYGVFAEITSPFNTPTSRARPSLNEHRLTLEYEFACADNRKYLARLNRDLEKHRRALASSPEDL